MPEGVSVVVWWPERSTSTDASRKVLSEQVALADATWSLARSSLWVAAIATGDLAALRTACEDRLHQPTRLAARPDSAAVLTGLLGDPRVHAAWLSGSGPTVAALADTADAPSIEAAVAAGDGGRSRVLAVSGSGVRTAPEGLGPGPID